MNSRTKVVKTQVIRRRPPTTRRQPARLRLSSRPNPYLYPNSIRNRRRRTRRLNYTPNPPTNTLINRRPPRTVIPRPMTSGLSRMGPAAKDFIACRITPFTANGTASSIPDGAMQRKVMIDHRMQIPFILGATGAMNIAVTPNIPCPVWFQSPVSDTYIVNGTNWNTWTSSTYNVAAFPEWANLSIALNNAAGNYDEIQTIMDSGRARIVTAGWSITYTGSTINNSGSLRVNTLQTSVGPSAPNPADFTVIDGAAGNLTVWSPSQVLVRTFNQNLSFAANNAQDTRTFALRDGAHGLLRHNSSTYDWLDLSANISFLAMPASEKFSLLNSDQQIVSSTKVGKVPLSSAYDTNWSATLLTISGAAPQSSFLLDLIYCIEYSPNPTNVAFSLAKPAPPRNDAVVQAADRLANAMPIAEQGNASNATLPTVLGTLSGAATIAKTVAAVLA